jgi:hypothetical protein
VPREAQRQPPERGGQVGNSDKCGAGAGRPAIEISPGSCPMIGGAMHGAGEGPGAHLLVRHADRAGTPPGANPGQPLAATGWSMPAHGLYPVKIDGGTEPVSSSSSCSHPRPRAMSRGQLAQTGRLLGGRCPRNLRFWQGSLAISIAMPHLGSSRPTMQAATAPARFWSTVRAL